MDDLIRKVQNEKDTTGERGNLFWIANSMCALLESKRTFEIYITDVDHPRLAMDYFFNMGYLVNLRYFKDHPKTSKSYTLKIDNIRNLGFAIYKMEDILERKDAQFQNCVQTIREAYHRMCLDCETLLQEELTRWKLAEYLIGIKEENKVAYINNVLSIPQGKGYPELPQVILNSISTYATLKSIVA